MRWLNVVAGVALAATSLLAAAGIAGVAGASAAAATIPAASHGWGTARALPGFASLNKAATSQSYPLAAESCTSAGNCAIGGSYSPSSGTFTAFVAAEKNGTWGTPGQIPGLATLDQGRDSWVDSLSCRAAGSCVAAGHYAGSVSGEVAFVATEKNGIWGAARPIPGLAALNLGNYATSTAVSCSRGPALDCAVTGFYYANSADTVDQTFVAETTHGAWGNAQVVPGLVALNAGGVAAPTSLACPSPGACVLTGTYKDNSGDFQAFLAGQRNGTWQQAEEIPGTGALNTGGNDEAWVACSSAGNCAISGSYTASGRVEQAFILTEKNGTWGTAQQIPGLAALAKGGDDSAGPVSCAPGPAEDCAIAGSYGFKPFVADERNGTWGSAKEIPGIAKLDQGVLAGPAAVSCGSPGNCSVVGDYLIPADQSGGQGQAFVASESNGTWGRAEQIPGTAALARNGRAAALAVSCAAHAACGASGAYNTHANGTGPWRIFVVSKPTAS